MIGFRVLVLVLGFGVLVVVVLFRVLLGLLRCRWVWCDCGFLGCVWVGRVVFSGFGVLVWLV